MHILSTYKTWLLYRRIVHTFHRNKMWIMFDVTSVSRCDVEEWPQSDTTYIHWNNVSRVLFIRQTSVKQDTTRGACSKRNRRLLQGTGITGEFWTKLLEPFVFVSTEICVVNVYNPLSSNVVSRIWGLGHTGPPPRAGPWNHPWEDHEKTEEVLWRLGPGPGDELRRDGRWTRQQYRLARFMRHVARCVHRRDQDATWSWFNIFLFFPRGRLLVEAFTLPTLYSADIVKFKFWLQFWTISSSNPSAAIASISYTKKYQLFYIHSLDLWHNWLHDMGISCFSFLASDSRFTQSRWPLRPGVGFDHQCL